MSVNVGKGKGLGVLAGGGRGGGASAPARRLKEKSGAAFLRVGLSKGERVERERGDSPGGVNHTLLKHVAEGSQANRTQIPLEHGSVPHRAIVREVRVANQGCVGSDKRVGRDGGNPVAEDDLLTRSVVDFILHEVAAVVRASGAGGETSSSSRGSGRGLHSEQNLGGCGLADETPRSGPRDGAQARAGESVAKRHDFSRREDDVPPKGATSNRVSSSADRRVKDGSEEPRHKRNERFIFPFFSLLRYWVQIRSTLPVPVLYCTCIHAYDQVLLLVLYDTGTMCRALLVVRICVPGTHSTPLLVTCSLPLSCRCR